ncbi:DUF1206 domain-containing protein [Metabacillus sp. GX 13764]|uniref:DUF1206 domain-containing protein n=1 Tax=Metabacillus kandeliae TaxID=2900151 RepID=UPI001E2EE302|nr:DUF1206 domain-containing protein [Metabacillus kandeliae]MCD7035102.1 DUF1206 domain-containing protein [Metabacillus kandeliae]
MEVTRTGTGGMHNERAKQETKPWIRRMGRAGYMAQGVVYGLIGILAFMTAIGAGGEKTDSKGALQSLKNLPLGSVLLWLIGLGLIGYVIWSFVKAIKDPENKGSDAKGIATRIGYAISGIIYGSLAFTAIKTAVSSSGSGGSNEQSMSAQMLSQPFGQWIIGIVGVITFGYGLYEIYSGWKEKFMSEFNISDMKPGEVKTARRSGKIGLIARGIVLAMVGFFITQTAVTADPGKTKGLDGALSQLSNQPYGQWLLGAVSLGLILFGVYGIFRGRYMFMGYGGK